MRDAHLTARASECAPCTLRRDLERILTFLGFGLLILSTTRRTLAHFLREELNTLGGRFQTHSADFLRNFIGWASLEQARTLILPQKNSAHVSVKQTMATTNCTVGNNVMESLSVYTYVHTTPT